MRLDVRRARAEEAEDAASRRAAWIRGEATKGAEATAPMAFTHDDDSFFSFSFSCRCTSATAAAEASAAARAREPSPGREIRGGFTTESDRCPRVVQGGRAVMGMYEPTPDSSIDGDVASKSVLDGRGEEDRFAAPESCGEFRSTGLADLRRDATRGILPLGRVELL